MIEHIEVFNPGDWPSGSPQAHYAALMCNWSMAVGCLFAPRGARWGLDIGTRIAIVIALGLIATVLVAWVATRQLAQPAAAFRQRRATLRR